MAEEENLDHLLVHPRATWNYNITINTHCLHKLISDVDKILDRAGERAEFESGCFGHYLDFPKGGYFQAQFIHSLLLRQIFIPGGSEDELWFALGKTKARFGKREFCLCTGLKFGRLSDIPSREYEVVPGGIHARYFQGRKKVVIADLKAPFMAEDFDRPHDALKLALLLFANRVLCGQDDRNQVAYWMFSLVEDVQAFNNFAWGHYVFKMTLHYIHQGFKLHPVLRLHFRYDIFSSDFASRNCEFWGIQFPNDIGTDLVKVKTIVLDFACVCISIYIDVPVSCMALLHGTYQPLTIEVGTRCLIPRCGRPRNPVPEMVFHCLHT
ncbi:hypothetical protein Q3G72_030602 [Acer saccharum]|nr:hypothetical protein Q3G72_030602 [Acer saccharum]